MGTVQGRLEKCAFRVCDSKHAVEGNGSIDTGGLYQAPSGPSNRKFDVVTYTPYSDQGNGPEPLYTDFTIVLLD